MGNCPPDMELRTYGHLALALGGSEDSFTGQLLLLIAKADPGNRARLRMGFPRQVAAWETWMHGRRALLFTPPGNRAGEYITAGELDEQLGELGDPL